MRYKRRFEWVRESVANANHLEKWERDNDEVYWDALWYAHSGYVQPFVVLKVESAFFVSSNTANTRDTDRGPYKTLAEAIVAAETMIALEGSST